MTPASNLVMVGLALLAAGGWLGWQAWKMEIAEGATEHERNSRTRRLVLGAVVLFAGAGCVVVSLSSA